MKTEAIYKKGGFLSPRRVLCGLCGREVEFLDKFCLHCGAELVWKRCPQCKSPILPSHIGRGFCIDCGAPLKGVR